MSVFHGDALSSILTYSTEECHFSFYFQADVMEESGVGFVSHFILFYLLLIRCQRKKLGKERAVGSYVV